MAEELKGLEAESDVLPHPKLEGGAEAGLPTDLGCLEQVGSCTLCPLQHSFVAFQRIGCKSALCSISACALLGSLLPGWGAAP